MADVTHIPVCQVPCNHWLACDISQHHGPSFGGWLSLFFICSGCRWTNLTHDNRKWLVYLTCSVCGDVTETAPAPQPQRVRTSVNVWLTSLTRAPLIAVTWTVLWSYCMLIWRGLFCPSCEALWQAQAQATGSAPPSPCANMSIKCNCHPGGTISGRGALTTQIHCNT